MVFETLSVFLSKLVCFHGYVNEYNGFPKPLTKEEAINSRNIIIQAIKDVRNK